MPEPWSKDKRAQVARKVTKEAARAAGRLGAKAVMMIAFFPEGREHFHIIEGGVMPGSSDATSPQDAKRKFYLQMASMCEVLDQNDGEDVALN